jgi:BirA family biotin operon repressor/biotin-[acetyl-CoA-carboxylase] ligase
VYVSVVLDDVVSPTVTLLAGVAVAEAIRTVSGVPVELEWPNDLVLPSRAPTPSYRRAKLGGVLTETVSDSVGAALVVVGIGVNVAAVEFPSSLGRQVTWLDAHASGPVVRGVLLVEILCALAAWQNRCAGDGAGPMLERWRELSPSSMGVTVGWDSRDGPRSGVTAGIGPDGSLRVRVGDCVENIVGGTLDWQVKGS